jgi:FtsX-like permease family
MRQPSDSASNRAFRVSWYDFRATIQQRWSGYLSIVLLIGLVGGVAMVSIAGARRSQSTFGAYLAATRASNLQLQTSVTSGQFGVDLRGKLARLPHVEHVADAPSLLVIQLGSNGKALPSSFNNNDVQQVGSTGGMYFSQDRVVVTQGQMADPASTDEMVATAEAARMSGWHVGQTVPFGAYSVAQANMPTFNPLTGKPWMRFSAKLVGLVEFSSQVVNDDVDRFPTYVLMTPALTKKLNPAAIYPTYGLRLDSDHSVPAVEREIVNALPPGSTYSFHLTSVVEGQVERATRPEVIALGVFGVIAALAVLLIGGLAISRQLWLSGGDLEVLRSLGADRPTLAADAMFGTISAVFLGAPLAIGVAVALSPLMPIGPASAVDPSPGVALDWPVLLSGLVVLIFGLGGLTVGLAHRGATRRHDEASKTRRRSGLVEVATKSGLPEPAIAGLRFSLERGRGRTAVPVRSALLAAVLAVTVVVATLTFGSSLAALNSHPPLYGWNWSYAINSPGTSSVPPVVGKLLSQDPNVAAWTGYKFANVQIDGLTVPILLTKPHAPLGPPLLSGHALDENDQVVLGSATLAALHKKVGDTVLVSYGAPKDAPVYIAQTPLLIVGTATMPAIGVTGHLHPSMGTGALVSTGIEPATFQRVLAQPDPNLNGPDMYVVRFKNGVRPSAARMSLQRIVESADKLMAADPNGQGDTYSVLSVQRPAEIVNYQSTGSTPGILAAGLAAGAVVALGLTLSASVRRRRRDLALLKAFGFTRRQLAATVACQASVAAIVGIIVGVPVGIALGRWLWDLFARNIYAVPLPTVPVLEVVLVALGAILLANLVAAVPGQMAARTPTALLLRSE